ncbi:hypothetical protein [Jiella avicenniae]|uniref:Uncharacterized protein n=1 Tax=Jiella avicenniae TaxID=2907202 RepID=A0A9X1T754_9HYPH|nr:hypothetical protein [Jiella avicenniae]MCE7030927.1 hypothetical protein [Jiella avicenniae]
MYARDTHAPRLTEEQSKALLKTVNYTFDPSGDRSRRIFGRVIGWAKDKRGFGAVVGFPNYHRSFFIIDPVTMRPRSVGAPPLKNGH